MSEQPRQKRGKIRVTYTHVFSLLFYMAHEDATYETSAADHDIDASILI
jgi:hypothetical protein